LRPLKEAPWIVGMAMHETSPCVPAMVFPSSHHALVSATPKHLSVMKAITLFEQNVCTAIDD